MIPDLRGRQRHNGAMRSLHRAGGLAIAGLLTLPAAAAAHGLAPPPPADAVQLMTLWSFDPLVQVPLIGTFVAYLAAVRTVNRAHPANRVPLRRTVAFVSGLADRFGYDGCRVR